MQLRKAVHLSRITRLLLTNRHRIYYTAINNLAEHNFISQQKNGQGRLEQKNPGFFDTTITKRCEFCSSSSAQNIQTQETYSNSDSADNFAAAEMEKDDGVNRNLHDQVSLEFAAIIRAERDNLPLKIRYLRRQTIATEGHMQLIISLIEVNRILLSFSKYPEFIKRKIRARLKGFKNHRNLAIRVPDGFQSADAEEYLNFTVKNKGINTLEIGALDRVIPFPAQIGQPLIIRRISDGERLLSEMLEMFNQPLSWWAARPGYQTLLYALKIKPIPVQQVSTSDTLLPSDRLNFYDAEQKKVIEAALDDKRPLIIAYGPKGTGKTSIASEVTNKLAEDGKRVLVVLEMSHIFEFMERLKQCSPQNVSAGRIIVLTGLESIPCSLSKARLSHPDWPLLHELFVKRGAALQQSASLDKQRSEFESINEQIVNLHRQIDDDIIHQAQILIHINALIQLVQSKHMQRFNPDVQIIDDVGIFNKSHCYAIISQAPRTIILGDTIEKVSLNDFENERIVSRMVDNFHTNKGICFPLTTQYSSNAAIFEWPNNMFYSGQIRTGESVANQLITDRLTTITTSPEAPGSGSDPLQNDSTNLGSEKLPNENISSTKFERQVEALFSVPLLFIDTEMVSREDEQFFRFTELIPQRMTTKCNLGEALLMSTYADLLVRKGHLQLDQIGFLTRPEIRNWQQKVFRHFLRNRLSGFDSSEDTETESFKQQFAIGTERIFGQSNWTRDVILRGRTAWNRLEEKAMALRWLAFALSNARRQFVLIDSKAHLQQLALPELDDFLKMISDKGLVVSPYEFITPEALKEARHLLLDDSGPGGFIQNQRGGEIRKTVSTIATQQRVQTQQRIPHDIGENRASQTGHQQQEVRQYTQSRPLPSGQTTIDGNNHQPARQRSLSNNNHGKNYQNDSQQNQQETHNWSQNKETGFQRQPRPAGGDVTSQNNYNQRQQQFVQSSTQKQYQNRPASESPSSSYPHDRSHSYRQSQNFQQHSQANLRSPRLDQIDGNKPFTLPPLQRQSDKQDKWQLWDEQEANYPELDQRQRQPVQRERQQQVQGSFYAGNSQPRSSPGFRQSNAEPTRRPPQFQSSLQREFSSDGYQQQTPYSPWKYVQGGRTMSRNSTQLEDEDWAMPPKYQLGFNSKGNTQPFNRHYQATSPNYQQRVEPQFRNQRRTSPMWNADFD